MPCDDCSYAIIEYDPHATGDHWYAEYLCTAPRCVENDLRIAYWPSGEWDMLEEVERGSYQHMSDDYTVVSLPGDFDDAAVEEYVRKANS